MLLGHPVDQLMNFNSSQGMLGRGITNWGEPVQDVLDDGALLINQVLILIERINFMFYEDKYVINFITYFIIGFLNWNVLQSTK